jgi:hypothetical protein
MFERREKAGGCWSVFPGNYDSTYLNSSRIADPEDHVQHLPNFDTIATRTPDDPVPIPSSLPTTTPKNTQNRFSGTSIYPTLETNTDVFAMSFSQEPFPEERSALNISRHGPNSPFRHWKAVEVYIQNLLNRNGYQDVVSYDTTVELVQKDPESGKWVPTLRKPLENGQQDHWWKESFDAVVVAAGHYTVPFIPSTRGLAESSQNFPGSVEHSKAWCEPEKYRGKRVVVVGASISGTDISFSLADVAETPLHSVVRRKYHPYFFDWAFQHPNILRRPPIINVVSSRETGERTVYFQDGTMLENVDHIIFGTGYTWTLHFLPEIAQTIRNNRLPNLYLHDPTLCFVGAVAAGFTFKVFEWQAVLVARFLAGRIQLPPKNEQIKWEEERTAYKGDGVPFTALYPDFEQYFEEVRLIVGEPTQDGKGRRLPKWEKSWREGFDAGHLKRINMWKRGNEEARERIRAKTGHIEDDSRIEQTSHL